MNILYMLGNIMFSDRMMINLSGLMMRAANGIAFALAHVGIYQAFDIDSKPAD